MGWVNKIDKRERILKAAESCLREQGLKQLNIRTIARAAGISLGSVHYYFPTKEDLLVEIFRRFVYSVTQATLAGNQDKDPREILMQMVDGYFAELKKEPGLCQVFIDLWDEVGTNEPLRAILDAYYQSSLDALENLIEEGCRSGLFHIESPALAAYQIIAMIDGIKVQIHLSRRPVHYHRLRDHCKAFILRALGNPA